MSPAAKHRAPDPDKRRAELSLRLTRDDEVIAEEQREIVGLAHNEWGGALHIAG